MPRLSNEKLERFARVYARKFDRKAAADAAGYTYASADVMCTRPEVRARVAELNDAMLKAGDITAQRVMLELGRVAFADIRTMFKKDGSPAPVHELDDDIAASISSIDSRSGKIKRFNKDAALGILAKHFKIVGDEGDGVNALASALAERLKTARKRADEGEPG